MAEVPPELAAELQKLERYHAENPEGRYFVPLANAYRKVGEVEQAEALLREGLRRHPEYLSAHIVLGRCLADRGAVGEAAEEFRYVLSVDPQNLIALRSLGDLASERGEGGEAARWYRELLSVDPMNEEARQALEALQAEEAAPSAPAVEEEAAAWGEIRLEGTENAAEPAEPAPAPDLYGTVELDALELPGAEEEAPAPAAEPGGWDPFGEGAIELSAELEEQEEELVTETIAELYARQGFHDRAAEVYRELIRRRGEEPALVRRLAELEAGAAADEQAAQEVVAEAAEETVAWGEIRLDGGEAAPAPEEPEPAVDAFAASFETGFGDAPEEPAFAVEEAVALAEPPPEEESFPAAEEFAVEEPAVQEPAAGGTVRDYLSALVAWSPPAPFAAPVAEEPAAEAPPAEPEPEEVVDVEMEMPWLSPAPGPAAEGGEEAEAEEPLPWELSPELSTVEAAAPVAEEAEEDGFSFEDFFVETPEEAAPEVEAAEPRAEEPAPAPEPEPAAEGEDEDLESFQAWLQSLKR